MTTRRRRTLVAVAGAALSVALAGCVGLPTAGPVGVGNGAADEPGTVFPLAYSPAAGADPESIVQGFLAAGAAGLVDNFTVARQYLAGQARTSWQPTDGVVVYSIAGALNFVEVSATQISVRLPVVATVDADGRYTEASPAAFQDAVFDLVKTTGDQWRISRLDNGVLLSEPIFYSVYRPTSLYFLTLARDLLVPEVRWFPQRNAATYAVRALLEGPSPWLRDAVTTAFPDGTRLAVDSVPVDSDGTATVDLTTAVASASSADRGLLKAQLEEVLQLTRVRTVDVTIAGLPMVDPPATVLVHDPTPSGGLVVLSNGALDRFAGTEPKPIDGVGALVGLDARYPAAGPNGTPLVLLSGPDTLVLAPTATVPARTLLSGTALIAPSVDRQGWAWSGPSAGVATLAAVRADATSVSVSVPWLEGRSVRSLRVSRDGTRIAIVSSGVDGSTVDVAGIVRDDSGAPQRVGDRLRVGARLTDAVQVSWVDESTLAVLGTSGTMISQTMHLVPITGRTRALPALEDATSIATGKGERELYVGTLEGNLYTLQGASWVEVANGVAYQSYAG